MADTGASQHYFMPSAPVTHRDTTAPPTTIRTAAGESHTSSASARLALPALPTTQASVGHIIPTFTNNLLSLGQLCDSGCTAHFDAHHLVIKDPAGTPIIRGAREKGGACLWRVNISPSDTITTPGPTLIPPDPVDIIPPPPVITSPTPLLIPPPPPPGPISTSTSSVPTPAVVSPITRPSNQLLAHAQA